MNLEYQKSILKLIEQYGSPLYIYDKSIIQRQINQLKQAFLGIPMHIHYACKANSNKNLLSYIKSKGINVDTVSLAEARHCLALGFLPENILFTPSFPSIEDLFWAMDNKLKVHISSMEYLPLLADRRADITIGIRINPEISIGKDKKISTGHVDSKFGIPVSHIDELLAMIKQYKIKVNALHLHPGSDISDWKRMAIAADRIFEIAPLFPDLAYIDLGSGYKVKFNPADEEIDLQAYSNHIKKLVQNLDSDVEIIIEPGKFLVSEAGVLVTKVELVMQGFTKQYAGVNSGFNHLIRPMYYDAYHEIINISNPNGEKQSYDVVGYLCEEDTFAYNRSIPEIKRGDYLLIKNAGAYGYTMSSNYNLREKPLEVFMVD